MNEIDLVKTKLLSIAFMGFVIILSGIVLTYFRDFISSHIRYVMPIPPIAVASYVFVYNMFNKYDGGLSNTTSRVLAEICWATLISSGAFLLFTILIIIFVNLTKNLL